MKMCRTQAPSAALVLLACAALLSAAEGVCLLKLNISTPQSAFTGSGKMTAPIPGTINSTPVKATGQLFLSVPTTSCPPAGLTAEDAVALLEKSSLLVPVDEESISFTPEDLKGNATDNTGQKIEGITVDFKGMQLAFTGNEPLAPGAVKLGTGSAAEAKAAAGELCSQLVMLGGELSMQSLLGPRTAAVKHVAMNRTFSAGASVKKGDAKVPVTLFLGKAGLALNISKGAMPGVEFTRATYLLSGDIVATADLANKASWQEVAAADVDWSGVPRLDSPIVIDPESSSPPAKGRIVGVNSTLTQQCTPTRTASAAAVTAADGAPAAAAAASPAKSAAGGSRVGVLQVLLAAAAPAVLAGVAML